VVHVATRKCLSEAGMHILRLVLQSGRADLALCNSAGDTALHVAAKLPISQATELRLAIDAVLLLCAAGGSILARDSRKRTPADVCEHEQLKAWLAEQAAAAAAATAEAEAQEVRRK
jgi:hypothetical protein